MAIVICKCGMWLKAPDPDQGGPSRCPSCGRAIAADGTISGDPDPAAAGTRRGFWRTRAARPTGSFPRRGRPISLGEALAYPVTDGPGLALLIVFPPFLTIMSVPVFDIVLFFRSGPRGGFNPLALLLIPFAMPLAISFSLTFGYVLLYLSRVLSDSAMGRRDHPRYPLWDWQTIVEGLARWIWAAIVGLGVGALPIFLYARLRPEFGPIDWAVVAVLVALAAGYVQMGLAAAILHDSLALAHPIAIGRAIARVGREYLMPWLLTAAALLLALGAWRLVMFHAPSLTIAALSLWGFWVFLMYEAMVVMHVLGWTCYRHAAGLGWFRGAPRWGAWERPGKIYTNS